MEATIRVAILEDHQSIIDGYRYRLDRVPQIRVVATAMVGSELKPMLAQHAIDVLLMDVNVPTSLDNPNPFPMLRVIPTVLQAYPSLSILVISMHAERSLIKAAIAAGISGYILKDDHAAIQELDKAISAVAEHGIYFSKRVLLQLTEDVAEKPLLTARQLEVLSLFAAYPDLTLVAGALKLGLAHSTVRNLLSNAYLRLNVRNRYAAIDKARQLGLLPQPAAFMKLHNPDAPDAKNETDA